MIWWVYEQAKKVSKFDAVYVATDDERISTVVREFGGNVIMTEEHPEHFSRLHEVSNKINADYYICILGDEPMIEVNIISAVIPQTVHDEPYFGGLMTKMTDPVKVVDPANIKVLTGYNGKCVYMTRATAPFPKGTLDYVYHKYLGIECFNKAALDLYVNTPKGKLERIEDINHLRYIENGVSLHFTEVLSEALSVDTPKDLEYVCNKIIPHGNAGNL
ncbi:3-deoxy-manno-octulosonate cytidylyltransferase [Clostridia bacterium]|nr:3-deoxy-manno-octulosonate cytidylyltransferase [Clostridia bacterium]